MSNQSWQWILWAIAMAVFLGLTATGHTTLLGLAITAVAIFWYTVVPAAHRKDNR